MGSFRPDIISTMYSFRDKTVSFAVGNQSIAVLQPDPNRVLAAFSTATGGCFARPNIAAASSFGFAIPVGGTREFVFSDYPGMVGAQWNVFFPAIGTLYVFEQFKLPLEG